ncbi:MAG: D-tyrosyl-tRNA(Tyr) deacylase [Deltaproteobacteria bacterium]|nr:D-tyrosyl-tRNA(Tyr) deacylase [Deltaproteobacteria bacterium]
MRAVIQRVSEAKVTVDGREVGAIGPGFLVLLGIARDDTPADAELLAEKVAGLRVFEDEAGKLNRSLAEVSGAVLVVSQFTLLGDCRKGRRPSFDHAAPPQQALPLYEQVVAAMRARGLKVETGAFQARMAVALVNDGPVTLLLDSRKAF